MDPTKAALTLIALGLAGAGLFYSGVFDPYFDKAEYGMDAALASPSKGCVADAGTTVPFPASGPLPLGRYESELAKATPSMRVASANPGGFATVVNQDAQAASVLFMDEDGRPVAKAFARGSESARVSLPVGAYDAFYETGTDWRGEAFGACAGKAKVKGIVVVETGMGSHVEVYGDMAFVLSNRMRPEVAERVLADDMARKSSRSAILEKALSERGDRGERPGYAPQPER
jgi:hypothetical protein